MTDFTAAEVMCKENYKFTWFCWSLESDLVEVLKPDMSLSLVSRQQDGVPRRPLLVLVPADQHQVEQVRVLRQQALAVPDRHHEVFDINRLNTTNFTRSNSTSSSSFDIINGLSNPNNICSDLNIISLGLLEAEIFLHIMESIFRQPSWMPS